MIRRDMSIEELVTALPESVRYLMDRGIKPIVCGEPIWDTIVQELELLGQHTRQPERT